MVKLLLDENLSPAVGLSLRMDGHDVVHVRERGLLGVSDHEVLERAFREERVLVTANVADFRKLAAAREVHAGVAVLENGGLRRDEQLEVLRRVLERLGGQPDMVNRLLIVRLDGSLVLREVPEPT
ncbi:DUF5615 family PIN-like protein [Myxococcota bacterium]|nr:DUF5615 family PIN-like protein [Myxococcota bacterium]